MLLIIILAPWFFIGYACWRIEYYTSIKEWYLEFGDDWRDHNNDDNAMTLIKAEMPFIILCGPLSLTFLTNKKRKCKLTWYFKIPANEDKS